MNRSIVFISFFFSTIHFSFSQSKAITSPDDKLIIELNYTMPVSTKLVFDGEGNETVGNHMQRKPIPQFSVAVSGKLHQYLYLKTAIGTSSIHHLLDLGFQGSAGSNSPTQTIFSNYRANYVYGSLLPEIRISESSKTATFYFNAGPSYYVCNNNEFYGGYVGPVYTESEMASQMKGHSFAWDINAGVDVRYKAVGLNVGFGYTSVTPHLSVGANNNMPSMGFRQVKILLGISYHLY